MAHSYTKLLYHLVFSTTERRPLITKTLRPLLYDYLGGTVRGLDGVAIEIGGVADHVHLLLQNASKSYALSAPDFSLLPLKSVSD